MFLSEFPFMTHLSRAALCSMTHEAIEHKPLPHDKAVIREVYVLINQLKLGRAANKERVGRGWRGREELSGIQKINDLVPDENLN